MTDSGQQVVWTASYESYGKSVLDEDPDNNGTNITFNLRFPGQYYDQESGLHYNYFRYYDPNVGRYTTVDPIGLSGSFNVYAYVGGNPIFWTDYFGLAEWAPKPSESGAQQTQNTIDNPPNPGIVSDSEGVTEYEGGEAEVICNVSCDDGTFG